MGFHQFLAKLGTATNYLAPFRACVQRGGSAKPVREAPLFHVNGATTLTIIPGTMFALRPRANILRSKTNVRLSAKSGHLFCTSRGHWPCDADSSTYSGPLDRAALWPFTDQDQSDVSATYSLTAARTRGGVPGFVMMRSIVLEDSRPNLCLFSLMVQTVARFRPRAFACSSSDVYPYEISASVMS